ncbi:hypothetical protein PPL_02319 [Heterostelium album PN500]|uniref:Uncharacterized protein n=1 Tax=Heterostelium pallidum (strain ATCC 26659 / Pp 5 / PN500) TaxID=670386 RepID=D3B1Z4_HETP5|nr:hypothetical protein PPL_02319 [Heterostelium album PN500]EFA85318.1 hypothetical protein PPL_02319 [Heterostelium album PN500]|eukprot:XP_020437427.1 hypothetical protein PPL_02319 [Heterostelium album PN500]
MQNLSPQLIAKILFLEYKQYSYTGNYNIVYSKKKSNENSAATGGGGVVGNDVLENGVTATVGGTAELTTHSNNHSDTNTSDVYVLHFDRQNYAYRLLIKHSLQLKGASPSQHSLYHQHWVASSSAVGGGSSVSATSSSTYQVYNNTSMSNIFPTFPAYSSVEFASLQSNNNNKNNSNSNNSNLSTGKRFSMALMNLLPKELDVLRKEDLDKLLKSGLLIKKLRLTHDSWKAYYPLIISKTLVAWPLETLDLSGNNLNDATVINILQNLASLRSLHLRSLNLSHNQLSNSVILTLARLVKNFQAPNNLNLSHNLITSEPIKPLLESMKSATSQFTLQLANNRINDLGGVLFCRYLQTNSNLISLNLANNNLTCETSILLTDALKSQSGSNMKSLKLSLVAMGQEEMKAFESALRSPNCRLARLSMAACAVTGIAGATLAQAGALSTSLVHLDLRYNMIAPTGAIALATSIATNTTLQSLNIGYCSLGQDFGTQLGNNLQRNRTLTKLWVNDNAIGADGFIAIADALATANCRLRLLDLSSNCTVHETLGLPAVSKLADALASNSCTLTDLNLSRNRLGHESLSLLAASLRTNRVLAYLNLSGNYIRGEGALALKGALHINRSLRVLTMNGAGLLIDGVKTILQFLQQQPQHCSLDAIHLDNNLQDDSEVAQIEPLVHQTLADNKRISELDVLPHILERRSQPYTRQRHYYKTKNLVCSSSINYLSLL